MLGLVVPQTELFLGDVVGEIIAFAAAFYATLVGRAFACGVPATAVLQQTWVPLQTQAICAETGLPQVFSSVTGWEARSLCCLGQGLKYGAIHSCNTGRRGTLLSKLEVLKTKACYHTVVWIILFMIEVEGVNKVAKTREDAAVKGELCYAKEMLWRFPHADNSVQWTMTINIVSSITVLSVYNSAVIWILLSLNWKLDVIAIKILSPTAR